MSAVRTILVAEDEDNDFFILNWAFARHQEPIALIRVTDGVEAIEYLEGAYRYADRQRFPMPDLLLLDLKMPRKDGLEVLEWLNTHPVLKSLVAVVLSSSKHERDVNRAYRLGANSYLTKPGDTVGFIHLTRALIDYWFHWSQQPCVLSPETERVSMRMSQDHGIAR